MITDVKYIVTHYNYHQFNSSPYVVDSFIELCQKGYEFSQITSLQSTICLYLQYATSQRIVRERIYETGNDAILHIFYNGQEIITAPNIKVLAEQISKCSVPKLDHTTLKGIKYDGGYSERPRNYCLFFSDLNHALQDPFSRPVATYNLNLTTENCHQEGYFDMTPKQAVLFCYNVVKGRCKEVEDVIATSPQWVYYYAKNVIKGRWIEAEPVLAISSLYSYQYAKDIIQAPWPEGEAAILQNPEWTYHYIKDVKQRRWREGERTILISPEWIYHYAVSIIKGRWYEAELNLQQSPTWARNYERHFSTKNVISWQKEGF